jgi:pimeloyl-ACP methyl ester carboxylesterase
VNTPTLVIAGEFDTWSYPEDRELLMRDLTNAPIKKSVLIRNATHFVLFEKPRFEFFNEVDSFLKNQH